MPLLRDLTWPEARRLLPRGPVLIPTGSTEQHGLHLPLGTDHLIAERLALDVADRIGCLVAPTIPYGISSEHRHFPGTMWISFEAFCSFVGDICISLARHGARKTILVNAHGGQQFAVQYLARQLRDEGIFLGVFEWWEGITPEFDRDVYGPAAKHGGHGCVKETAVGLHLFPGLVRQTKARNLPTNWGPRMGGGVTSLDCADFAPHGSIGYPKAATEKMGRTTHAFAVANLEKYLRHVRRTSLKNLLRTRIQG
ncbi:MAG: hypothetical protein A2Z34_04230 [Planctomycetes bacterium RBG_16_59_8]|nr:MAG: hypothetical protein A2Z34_04230 [Planctomycetes bacterium RBG_16_59_8]